jgi:hypothetical protein
MKNSLPSEIKQLENRLDTLRNQAGVGKNGEVIYRASMSIWPERDVVIEADGKGGAILMIVEGNYPIDFITHVERSFAAEDKACEAADEMVQAGSLT